MVIEHSAITATYMVNLFFESKHGNQMTVFRQVTGFLIENKARGQKKLENNLKGLRTISFFYLKQLVFICTFNQNTSKCYK